MSGDEILQYGQTFAEVGENGLLDDVTGGFGHEAAHTGKLPHLLAIATSTGIDHEGDGIVFLFAVVLIEGAQHDVGDLVGAVRPDIDDFVVAFARRNNTLAILLLNFIDLLLGSFDFLVLFLGDDHVIDANGNTSFSRFAEAEFLELVQGGDGLFVAADLVALPDQVSELGLADDFVRKTQFFWPDFAEGNAANGRLDDLLFGVAIFALAAKIGIGQKNALVGGHSAVGISEYDFALGTEQLEPAVLFGNGPRFGSEIITPEGDVLGRRHDRLAAGRAEDVVRGHHQQARFQLRFN